MEGKFSTVGVKPYGSGLQTGFRPPTFESTKRKKPGLSTPFIVLPILKMPTKTFLVSDESINSYGCRVLSAGGDSAAFVSNPVMLYMHVRGNVIGKWDNLRQENGKWYADAEFDTEDDMAKAIAGKVERGFLKAASAGIYILETAWNDVLACVDIVKWAFQEISVVDIGSNNNALIQFYDKAGDPITELKLTTYLDKFKPTNQPPNKPMALETKTLAATLGLPDTATDADVLTAITTSANAVKELGELRLSAKSAQTQEAAGLVDKAIEQKRIQAGAKDGWLKLFAGDHESAKATLATIPEPTNLVQLAAQGQSAIQQNAAEDVKQYDTMDKAGSLAQFKASNPDDFKRMYKAKFGKEPDKLA